MNKQHDDTISVGMSCTAPTVVGNIVELCADMTVQPISKIGSSLIVGEVCARRGNDGYNVPDPLECTVITQFSRQRTRVSGAAVPLGPFVFGPGDLVFPFVPGTPAESEGSAVGPFAVVAGTNDALKVTVGTHAAETITLAPGAARTAAQVAADISAQATHFYAEADSDGTIDLISYEIGVALVVGPVDNDCYTLLGLTAATTNGTWPSACPSSINGLALTHATTAGQNVECLEL